MARQRHLPHAPITEALIDIHVEPRLDITFAGLQQTIATPEFGYYVKNPISQGTFAFKLTSAGEQPQTTAESSQIGLRLHSHDEKYVAQCRLTGFTLSRLPPYEEWSNLIRETKRVWEIYTERLAPVRVTRVATRFINNLQLPMNLGGSFQEYLHKFVDVPSEVPQAVASFLQRFQLVDVQSNALVNLTLALESTPALGPAPVVLDVDAFIVKDLNPWDEELWAILEHLRALKNQCFFGSLTERAAELYE
ncbi:MAG: TIGR04255 family protein [Gammaproteobacteria bacterium]